MKYLLVVIICLLAGLIIARGFVPSIEPAPIQVANIDTSPQNLLEVEQALRETAQARDELIALLESERKKYTALSSQVETLIHELEIKLDATQTNVLAQRDESFREDSIRADVRGARETTITVDKLLEAGFSEYEAERILELEAEARERLREAIAEDPDNRSREFIRELALETSSQLRTELGDYGYETYLETTGQPTSVSVRDVEPESTATSVGILPGDEILSYAGERVFSISDLQSLTTAGTEGESVLLEVVRDDQQITMVLPRGEIGISSGGRPTSRPTSRPGR